MLLHVDLDKLWCQSLCRNTAQLWNYKRPICPEAASQCQDENQTDHDVLSGQL